MAKLYSDEDFSYPVVNELRLLGHDVMTAQEAGQGNLGVADFAVLAFANAQDRAVLTFNHGILAATKGRSLAACPRRPGD
jgi:hypothetical protein